MLSRRCLARELPLFLTTGFADASFAREVIRSCCAGFAGEGAGAGVAASSVTGTEGGAEGVTT